MTNSKGLSEIFPWQVKPWEQLCLTKQKKQLSHAYLILGPCGIGKERFAKAFASILLCPHTNVQGETCGNCHACHLVKANSHPDLIDVAPDNPGQLIKIDQIREVVHFVNETSLQSSFRVIIINRAHHMNHSAANALLKTLEEPPPKTVFILLSEHIKHMQATITSRCQRVMLHKPSQVIALDWIQSQLPGSHTFSIEKLSVALDLAGGAPLKALSILSDDTMIHRHDLYQALAALHHDQADPLQMALLWQEKELTTFFNLIQYWLNDLLKLQMGVDIAMIINKDYYEVLKSLSSVISKQHVLRYLTIVQSRYSKIMRFLNLNKQLLLEELFVRWTTIGKI